LTRWEEGRGEEDLKNGVVVLCLMKAKVSKPSAKPESMREEREKWK
jgi:hypothetical protein